MKKILAFFRAPCPKSVSKKVLFSLELRVRDCPHFSHFVNQKIKTFCSRRSVSVTDGDSRAGYTLGGSKSHDLMCKVDTVLYTYGS